MCDFSRKTVSILGIVSLLVTFAESQCTDIAPDASYTCAQQKAFGKCDTNVNPWMKGKCDRTCGRCVLTPLPTAPLPTAPATFKVVNGRIVDPNGREFVMRGVNIGLQYYPQYHTQEVYRAISTVGFNTVRMVWEGNLALSILETAIQNCIANKMVPVVEIHSITGKNSAADLRSVAAYLKNSASTLNKYSKDLIINIANEWPGGWSAADSQIWHDTYIEVIPGLRRAGLRHMLVVDAGGYGQNTAGTLLNANWATEVFNADPDRNTAFSAHLYDVFDTDAKVFNVIKGMANKGLAFIVGEFGHFHLRSGGCAEIEEAAVFKYANNEGGAIGRKTGWIAWSWKGNNLETSYLDLVACSVNSKCNTINPRTCADDGKWAVSDRNSFGSDWGQKVYDRVRAESLRSTHFPGTSTTASCTNVPPDATYTCAQQKDFGKCDTTANPWMRGKCDRTCGRCVAAPRLIQAEESPAPDLEQDDPVEPIVLSWAVGQGPTHRTAFLGLSFFTLALLI